MKAISTLSPCAKCPFRKDVPIYLRLRRREEIARMLADGGSFPCHATVDYGEDEADVSESLFCAGAAKSLALSGGSSQELRIAERLGLIDLERIENHGIETWTLDEWTRLAEGATGDEPTWEYVETCNTVEADCLAPAGYLGANGGVVNGTDEADLRCPECGEGVCSNCASDEGLCGNCAAWNEGDDE